MQQVIKNIFSLILIISICEAGLLLPAIAHGDGTLYIKLDDEKDAKARIKKKKKRSKKSFCEQRRSKRRNTR